MKPGARARPRVIGAPSPREVLIRKRDASRKKPYARPSEEKIAAQALARAERRIRRAFALLGDHAGLWEIDPRDVDAFAQIARFPVSVRRVCFAFLPALECPIRRIMQYQSRELTLSEIGDAYGVTRERIRQVEEYALARLKVSRAMRDANEAIAERSRSAGSAWDVMGVL